MDLAVMNQRHGVAWPPFLSRPKGRDQRGALADGIDRELTQSRLASVHRGGLQRQVLRRVTDQKKLGKQRDVGAERRGLRDQSLGLRGVAGNVADDRIGLHRGDDETIGHSLSLMRIAGAGKPANSLSIRRGERARGAHDALGLRAPAWLWAGP